MRILTGLTVFIVFLCSALAMIPHRNIEKEIEFSINTALQSYPENVDFQSQTSKATSLSTGKSLFERNLNKYIDDHEMTRDRMSFWNLGVEKYLTATACGTDGKHHIVNSFFRGFAPFYTDEAYVPLYTLAMRKKYMYDHIQYNGKKDVWQNSIEGFKNINGDCEDHSIVLADWMIQLGYDSRVVIGTYKKSGHAWVIVFDDKDVFLLEATSKRRESDFHKMPYASAMKDYHPKFMFNNTHFWVNTGSSFTTSYKSRKWIKKSVYYSM